MKRALVLSGGGDRIGFEVGCVRQLLRVYHDAGIDDPWQQFYGVSAGAIVATACAQGREWFGALERFLLDQLRGDADIWRPWPLKSVQAYFKCGLKNPHPALTLFRTYFDWARVQYDLFVGLVQVEDKRLYFADPANRIGALPLVVLASSSFVPEFPPVMIGGRHYIDGGHRDVVPLAMAIDNGADYIDLVLARPVGRLKQTPPPRTLLGTAIAAAGIAADEMYTNDVRQVIKHIEAVNDLVAAGARPNKRHVTVRTWEADIDFDTSLDFDPERMRLKYQHGINIVQRGAP